jgi:hypothetical protein
MGDIWLDSRTWYYRPAVGNLWQERFIGKRFDSYLGKSSHPTQNHGFHLYLRVFLNPVNKRTTAKDANKKTFPIKDWTSSGWEKFTEQFKKQSGLWNNKFWLVPPRHFSIADFDLGRKFVRPNITCLLHTELADAPGKAHRTIDVFNIDVDEVKRRDNLDDDNPRLGQFRADDRHLDSTHTDTGPRHYQDQDGNEYTVKHHYTIAHEIGHAIGLDHIGQLKHTKRCELALQFEKEKKDPKDQPILRGGHNSRVCYGQYDNDAVGLAENIMGIGYKFEAVNARPWKKRLAMHTNTLPNDWRVSLVPIQPQAVSEQDRHTTNQRKWIAM